MAASLKTICECFPDFSARTALKIREWLVRESIEYWTNQQLSEELDKLDDTMHGYGIEVLRAKDYWNKYWGDAVAFYVNRGDTYDMTIVYDLREQKPILTSWGDWVERRSDIV